MAGTTPILQVVNKDGEYATEDVQRFAERMGLDRSGVDYQIVAIMGPQSSGKSTLLNSVFGTKFVEMDALRGRQQTTRGIWMARSPKIESQVLIMDLEGSDGRERGEDDTSFERQSALFALAASDVMLINMWAKDIGRESGSGKPLLKTIFQVNLKLFTPAPGKRRTVLLFVFRDRTRTPLPRLIETWQEDLNRMWETIPKPPQYERTSVSDFFEVQYAALPNFEEREEDFRAESVILRRRFTDQEEDTLLRTSEDKLPGQALALSMQKLWQVILEQKDLNLPAHKVMVANIRCAEIAEEQLQAMLQDQAWLALRSEAASELVSDFGARTTALIHSCLAGYDEEARYFESAVRADKRRELVNSAYSAVADARHAQLDRLQAATLERFQADLATALETKGEAFSATAAGLGIEAVAAFEEAARDLEVGGSGWTAAEAHASLEDQITAHVRQLEQHKVAAVTRAGEAQLRDAVTGAGVALLDSTPSDLWQRLHHLHAQASASAAASAFCQLKGYDLTSEERAALEMQLEIFSRELVEGLVREASHTVLSRMKDRFNQVFSRDDKGMPRSWTPRVDVGAIAVDARRGAAAVLALLACLRVDAAPAASAVLDAAVRSLAERPDQRATIAGFDMLSGSEWPDMPKANVLLTPGQCRGLWRQFVSDSDLLVGQAMATQEANRAASNRTPPLWAIVAMVLLGWNEFFAVLRNPLWLLCFAALLLFGKTVYQDLEVDAEMQRGLLPGLLVLGSKLGPTVRSAASRTVAGMAHFAQDAPQRAQESFAAIRSPAQSTAIGSSHGESIRRRQDNHGSGIEMTDSTLDSQHTRRSPLRLYDSSEDAVEVSKDR